MQNERLSLRDQRSMACRAPMRGGETIMAVDFYRNVQVLIEDFQRRGLHPEVVATSGGEPPRAVQIRVANALMVHWDADSRTVWAEGPWPEVQRIEAYIRRRFSGGMRRKLRRPKILARVVGVCIVLALIFGVCVPLLRKRPLIVAPPPSSTTAETVKEPATTASAGATHRATKAGDASEGEESSTDDSSLRSASGRSPTPEP